MGVEEQIKRIREPREDLPHKLILLSVPTGTSKIYDLFLKEKEPPQWQTLPQKKNV